jgi:hypothetical protein
MGTAPVPYANRVGLPQDLGVGLLETGISCPECRFRRRRFVHPATWFSSVRDVCGAVRERRLMLYGQGRAKHDRLPVYEL